jgi:hypothetical protein
MYPVQDMDFLRETIVWEGDDKLHRVYCRVRHLLVPLDCAWCIPNYVGMHCDNLRIYFLGVYFIAPDHSSCDPIGARDFASRASANLRPAVDHDGSMTLYLKL